MYNCESSLDAPACETMKDIARLLMYAVGSLGVIYLLIVLGSRESISGYTLLPLALLLVVIVPAAIGVAAARRERMRREAGRGGRLKGRDAGAP